MPEIVEHVAYLSQEIGPRPAGTEEEQQAALYITEQLQKDAGLSAVIEDFNSASGWEAPRAICCGVTLVFTLLSLFLPVMAVPAVVASILAAALFAAEALGRPILSTLFVRGVSQNVVAKYEPGYSSEGSGSRRRKIVLVSHYDSGKVRAELNGPVLGILPIIQWATFGAMVFIPLLLLIRTVFFAHAEGGVAVAFNVLTIIALILVALPLVEALVHKLAAYNEGANCNAAGTAVLLEVARRVGHGRVSEAELAQREGGVVHGEEAALAAGLVPEGAKLVYEAAQVKPPEIAPQSAEARLAAAKAAVAALSGKPVSGASASDIAQNLVQVKEPPLPQPTDDAFREQRDETREAFTTIPPETVQEALARASEEAEVEAGMTAAAQATPPSTQPVVSTAAAPVVAAASSFTAASAQVEQADSGVPDWFKKAQEKAKKPVQDNAPVHRSRYASALDAAFSESAGHFAQANNAIVQETEKLESQRDEIREVKAPQWAMPATAQAAGDAPAVADDAAVASAAPVEASAETAPEMKSFWGAPLAQQPAVEPVAAASDVQDVPAEPAETTVEAASSADDPFATTAMAPIDVSELHLGDVPTVSDVPMPSFLDPRNAQREALEARAEEERTANRIDVTAAEIGASGRIEVHTPDETAPVSLTESSESEAPHAARRPIVLPDIGAAVPSRTPVSELSKQRAPLAEAEEVGGKSAAKSLLNMLPAIDLASPSTEGQAEEASDGAASTPKASLRSVLPSLSGAISSKESQSVSVAGAFVPAGATGTFAPVGDELIENVDPNDIYVDDADDSAYEENFTETGAFAGPGYVEMPKSRIHRLFDRFRRKNKDDEDPTPQEWLDVDESFDARTVGAQRGGWESFRPEDGDAPVQDVEGVEGTTMEFDAYTDFVDDPISPAQSVQTEYFEEEFDEFDVDDVADEGDAFPSNSRGRWHGGAFSRMRIGRVDTKSTPGETEAEPAAASVTESETSDEIKQIYQFRNPDINTEVWFVALGSELADHAGMRAFLAEHRQDLRGAIIVDLDALGAGDLCLIEREGRYFKAKTSSRMRRYLKKASQATGISVGQAEIGWEDSSASYAIKQGMQAMHLAGMDGGKPALYAQGDDVLENIDEETLKGNADFVMELLKKI